MTINLFSSFLGHMLWIFTHVSNYLECDVNNLKFSKLLLVWFWRIPENHFIFCIYGTALKTRTFPEFLQFASQMYPTMVMPKQKSNAIYKVMSMPPVAMITIFGSCASKHYKTMLVIFILAFVTGVPSNLLEELLSNTMELGQNGNFYRLSVTYFL